MRVEKGEGWVVGNEVLIRFVVVQGDAAYDAGYGYEVGGWDTNCVGVYG
jgi:hypothetical protein